MMKIYKLDSGIQNGQEEIGKFRRKLEKQERLG